VDRREYLKQYRQSPEYKAKNAERMRKRRQTQEGKAYDKEYSKALKRRFNTARTWNTKRRRNFHTKELDLKEWTITFEQFTDLLKNPCYYCNNSLRSETGSGLDRKDNSKGYLPDNVNPCCSECNRIRGDTMDAEEFKRQTKLNGRWHD
jgi:hypothetical protein